MQEGLSYLCFFFFFFTFFMYCILQLLEKKHMTEAGEVDNNLRKNTEIKVVNLWENGR